jgi:hypothetical protein
MPWSRAFEDPIPLPRGRQLVALKDAAAYIMKLSKAEQHLEEWQAATEALFDGGRRSRAADACAHRVLRALNRNVERVFDASRKETHWGWRKLRRD